MFIIAPSAAVEKSMIARRESRKSDRLDVLGAMVELHAELGRAVIGVAVVHRRPG